MSHIRSVANLFSTSKSIVETTANLCGVGAACAAAWAFFFPEQAADQWVKFETHLEQARKDLTELRANSEEIVANTSETAKNSKQTSENTSVVAKWVQDMSSVERGLEVHAFAYSPFESPKNAVLYTSVSNPSTTPLEQFKYVVLDGQKNEIGTRRTARLIQFSSVDAELNMIDPASEVIVDGYRSWICASGKITNTNTTAYFTVELEGNINSSEQLIFSVVRNEVANEASEACQLTTN